MGQHRVTILTGIGVLVVSLLLIIEITLASTPHTPQLDTSLIINIQKDIEKINEQNQQIQSLIESTKELLERHTPLPEYNLESFERIEGIATTYTLHINDCGKPRTHPAYGITKSGLRAKKGRTVAVDPKVIPLGSVIYIKIPEPYEYLSGVYVAEDIGSGVKGKHVDIFFGEDEPGQEIVYNESNKFGKREATIYILERGSGVINPEIISRGYQVAARLKKEESD